MRIHLSMRHLLLLLAIAAPTLLRAQFQPPTPEELNMTDDPKAPGAAAVYLNLEEVTDDVQHFHSFYARIKVLREKGEELATVEIPYQHGDFKVSDIKARTIHSDGTVVPLNVKPKDLLVAKTGDWEVGRMVFSLPSVEVGSILEYRYLLKYDENEFSAPYWEIQKPYFVHRAHYAFTPFPGFLRNGIIQTSDRHLVGSDGIPVSTLVWWTALPPGTQLKEDATGRYKVDLTDIPPQPDEDWMPPIESILYRVIFSYSNSEDLQNYWVFETKLWSKEVDRFAEPSNSIREAVSALIVPGDSDLEKAKKLYKAVQALENTDFSRTKGKAELKELGLRVARHAEDTWSQKSGSSQEITWLYLAMLRAAGLTAYAAKVVDREKAVFDPGYLNFEQLTGDIVILAVSGQEILLDPGEKMCPFQFLDWKHSGARGTRQSPDGHDAITTPFQSFKQNSLLRIGDVTIDEHGATSGVFRFVIAGQEALRWRQTALEYDLDDVKKQFDRWLDSMVPQGVEAHLDHFRGLDDPDASLVAVVKTDGTLGSATSKRLLLPGFFFETRGSHPFVDRQNRLEPVDMHFGEQVTDQVSYRTPPGLAVEGVPQDTQIIWQDRAVLVTKAETAPGSVTIGRTFGRAFTVVDPKEYQDLRGFYQKVAAADQQQLVLIRTPAPKGN